MNILVTGAKGMVGTALCNNLKALRDGTNRMRPNIHIALMKSTNMTSTTRRKSWMPSAPKRTSCSTLPG